MGFLSELNISKTQYKTLKEQDVMKLRGVGTICESVKVHDKQVVVDQGGARLLNRRGRCILEGPPDKVTLFYSFSKL